MAGTQRFTNKIAFITGAASGIGRAAALAFAAEGARVAILDRSDDALRSVAASIQNAGGRGVADHLRRLRARPVIDGGWSL